MSPSAWTSGGRIVIRRCNHVATIPIQVRGSQVEAAEREIEHREARTLPMPPAVAVGFGGCLMMLVAGMGFGMLQLVLEKRRA